MKVAPGPGWSIGERSRPAGSIPQGRPGVKLNRGAQEVQALLAPVLAQPPLQGTHYQRQADGHNQVEKGNRVVGLEELEG